MNWSEVAKKIVQAGAPILGGILAGPAGASVGTILAQELGAEPNPDSINQALMAISEREMLAGKLRDIQNRHLETLRALELMELKIQSEDIRHARESNREHWMPSALTITLAVMVAAITGMLVLIAVPDNSKEVVFYLAGQIVTSFLTAVSYWLGASRISSVRDGMLGMFRKSKAD